ncbi:MAG: hypothetical protein LIP77_00885 [Planctomycetes bacterium]|nr:hypothetical protein [Planctomycetota bacterium]
MRRAKILLPLAILLAGGVGIALMFLTRRTPDRRPPQEAAQIVETILVQPMTVVPRVTTYGEVAPDRTWAAVSQVSGRVTWKSEKLKNGEFVAAGEEVLRLDDREYRLAVSRSQAEIDKAQAKLTELETNRHHLGGQLDLFQEALEYNERELDRQRNLHASRAVSASAVEQQEIVVLEQRRSLASLQSDYDLLPSQIAYQRAELVAAMASRSQAELDLTYTTFTAPFRGRIDETAVETDQFVPTGQTLFKLDSIAEAEITIGLGADKLAMLAGLPIEKVVEDIVDQRPSDARERTAFTVMVSAGPTTFRWPARFGRISASVDPATRMTELVVVVENPYRRPQPGELIRPPLTKGSFCTVVATGRPQPGLIVIPRKAIHEGSIYVADAASRLEIRPVTVRYLLDNYAVVDTGVTEGETLVTSDIVPAVPGMLLEGRRRDDFYEQARQDIGEPSDD